MNAPMPFATAKNYADKIAEWLTPHCHRLEIAGSIRRERPVCNDIDLVTVPVVIEQKDMLGEVLKLDNVLWCFLKNYVASEPRAKFLSGGEQAGKLCSIQLPKCQLDIWFTTPEHFASQLLCRTGSKEHNIVLAKLAERQGMKWKPYEGLASGLGVKTFQSESDLYAALGLKFIEPKHRELDWLRNNVREIV